MIFIIIILLLILIDIIFMEIRYIRLRKLVSLQLSIFKHAQITFLDNITKNYEYLNRELNKKVSVDDIISIMNKVLDSNKRTPNQTKNKIKNNIKRR